MLHRPGQPADDTLEIELPLPGQHLKEAKNASFHDLTPHPWAGLPVEMKLVATDALGQIGESDKVTVTLPERVFHHPIAKAIIEQRKQLTLNPKDRDVVAETLSDLSRRPGLFGGDIVAFMALRMAPARLMRDQSDKAIAEIQQLLWDTALRIENGKTSSAQRDLRQVMQDLQDALARNAPDSEIERLTQELKEAMDRYLRAMAEQMQRQGPQQNMQPIDPSRMMSRQDLQRMIDRARDMARTGSREAAKDLLSRLQEMLENLRMAQPGQMQDGQSGQGQQAMRQMQDMMRRQQQLLDRSFRQSRPGQQGQRQPGQQGQQGQQGEPGDEGGDDAAEQDALRRMLGDMMGQMGEQGGDIPQALQRAERAMRGASDALNRRQPGQAIGPQTEALDQLQQAARDMANRMMGRQNGPNGEPDMNAPRQADRDPFGRPQPQENNGQTNDDGGPMRMGNGRLNNYSLEKAKEILDELRRRAGERSRPDIERDYIERLLKQF